MNYLPLHVVSLDPHLSLLLVEDQLNYSSSTDKNARLTLLPVKLKLLEQTLCNEDYENTWKECSEIAKELPNQFMIPQQPSLIKFNKTCEELDQFHNNFKIVLDALSNPELTNKFNSQDQLGNYRHLVHFLGSNFQLPLDFPTKLFHYAKGIYETGDYVDGARLLNSFLLLVSPSDQELILSALWGSLCTNILLKNWDTALSLIFQLSDYINNKMASSFSAVNILMNRKWLTHWALFVFFNHPNGRNSGAEFYLQSNYLNVITSGFQYLYRYLIFLVLIHRRRKQHLKELLRVLQSETSVSLNNYSKDPFIRFFQSAFVQYNFVNIDDLLKACKKAAEEDTFLRPYADEFIESARLCLFEVYCKFHRVMSISKLSHRLCLSNDEVEPWIVKYIRSTKLDGKIDSETGNLLIGPNIATVYQQVIDKTKVISHRTSLLCNQASMMSTSGPSMNKSSIPATGGQRK